VGEFELLNRLIEIANKRFDGHLTIMKFTTNWRIGFRTPHERDHIDALPVGTTFGDAAREALASVGESG
jgi:hypothetical protein